MEVEQILRDFGLILGAGLVAQFLATVTRVPEMILLVAAGALVGPSVLGLVRLSHKPRDAGMPRGWRKRRNAARALRPRPVSG